MNELLVLRAAAVEMLNAAPLDGDLRLLMLACKALPLNADDIAYAERYAAAREGLKSAIIASNPSPAVPKDWACE